jgi:hypothetical protein
MKMTASLMSSCATIYVSAAQVLQKLLSHGGHSRCDADFDKGTKMSSFSWSFIKELSSGDVRSNI